MQLHGTLTRPAARTRGLVLLIGGSGKTDRDETVDARLTVSGKQEKLFKQVSDALVDAGFTTFRYDKRGVFDEGRRIDRALWSSAHRDNLIADAMSAARLLLEVGGHTEGGLLILGHSEGTIIGVEVALALESSVRGLLLLGAQARSMEAMLAFQISSAVGNPELAKPAIESALAEIRASGEGFAPDDKPFSWYRQHLAAPANKDRLVLSTAKVAIFQGESDPQTPIDEIDLFIGAGRRDLLVHRYPGLGHGFSMEKGGKPTLGPIEQRVLDDIVRAAVQMATPDRPYSMR